MEKKYIYLRILTMLNNCIVAYRDDNNPNYDIAWLHGFLEGVNACGIISCKSRFAIEDWCNNKYHKAR